MAGVQTRGLIGMDQWRGRVTVSLAENSRHLVIATTEFCVAEFDIYCRSQPNTVLKTNNKFMQLFANLQRT